MGDGDADRDSSKDCGYSNREFSADEHQDHNRGRAQSRSQRAEAREQDYRSGNHRAYAMQFVDVSSFTAANGKSGGTDLMGTANVERGGKIVAGQVAAMAVWQRLAGGCGKVGTCETTEPDLYE